MYIFIGYSTRYKGYRCLDPTTNRIYTTRHARFDEHIFPFANSSTSSDLNLLAFTSFDEPLSSPPTQPQADNSSPYEDSPMTLYHRYSLCLPVAPSPAAETAATDAPSMLQESPVFDSSTPLATPQPTPSRSSTPSQPIVPSTHPMITRGKVGIVKPKHFADLASLGTTGLVHALFTSTIPKGFKSTSKHTHWLMAMDEEMSALRDNITSDFLPRPAHSNVVGSKSIFNTKFHSDGTTERYKAHLVAQGLTQVPRLDFSHTFSPVVKASTVRIVLTLAVMHQWPLHQLDVKNAFLNGMLSKTAFMEQPPVFVDEKYPLHVCRLKKALYGLKQAPRDWF